MNFAAGPNFYSINIPSSMLSQTIIITPIQDADEEEGAEDVIVNLVDVGEFYTLGGDTEITIVIADFQNLVFKDGFESP